MKTGVQIKLRDSEIVRAFFVCPVACQKEIIRLCFPKEDFQVKNALRAFLCTDAGLSIDSILDFYTQCWLIEVFFRQCKSLLALAA